jgi:hypothetical protein
MTLSSFGDFRFDAFFFPTCSFSRDYAAGGRPLFGLIATDLILTGFDDF